MGSVARSTTIVALSIAVFVLACSAPPEAPTKPPAPESATAPPPPAPESEEANAPQPEPPAAATGLTPSEAPAAAKPAAPPAQPEKAVPATVPVASKHEAVGPEKCKMCHKVQYESWSASKHATVNPKADCETCHGNGKDYIVLSVMKDRAKALAAGLVLPGKEFCTAKCHKPSSFKPEMLAKVHAHKAR